MNKLFNLLIIFLSLKYFLPFVISNIHQIPHDLLYVNLATSFGIFLIELSYNYFLNAKSIKPITFKQNVYNSLFKALIVFVGYYIYDDVKSNYSINIPGVTEDSSIKSLFVIFIMTLFIVTKCLITP